MTEGIDPSTREGAEEQRDLTRLRAEIAFGLDVQKFMGGSIGRYIAARANDEIVEAQEELVNADPHDPVGISKIQMRAKVAASVLVWLGQAVSAGFVAEQNFVAAEEQL